MGYNTQAIAKDKAATLLLKIAKIGEVACSDKIKARRITGLLSEFLSAQATTEVDAECLKSVDAINRSHGSTISNTLFVKEAYTIATTTLKAAYPEPVSVPTPVDSTALIGGALFKNLRVVQTNGGTDPEFELRCDPIAGDTQVEHYVLATIYSARAAELIAATPDLLDALKSTSFIVDYIMARAEFNRPEERLHWEAAQRNAHAAIAKAEPSDQPRPCPAS